MLGWIPWVVAASAAEEEAIEVLVVATSDAPGPAPTVLTGDEVAVLPGGLGDPIRAVQGTAGVGRSPFGLGLLLLRGTDPGHQGIWFGGVPLPRAMHFGGLATVLDPALLDGITVVGGAPASRYGGRLGGMVMLRPTPDRPETLEGQVAIDLFGARASVSVPTDPATTVTAGFRRSWLDVALQPVVAQIDQPFQLPWYTDGHLRILHDAPRGGTVTAWFIGSSDRLELAGEVPTTISDQAYVTWFLRGIVEGRTVRRRGWSLQTTVAVGPDHREVAHDDATTWPELGLPLPKAGTEATESDLIATTRVAVERDPIDGLGLDLGIEGTLGRHQFTYEGDERLFGEVGSRSLGGWAEATILAGPVGLSAGGRADGWIIGDWQGASLDPRGRVTVNLAPRTALHAAAARSHQAPAPRQVAVGAGGTPDLDLPRSWHVTAGIEQGVGPVEIAVAGYHTDLVGLPVGREDLFRFDDPILPGPRDSDPWRSTGAGTVWGVEASGTLRRGRTLGWIAATVSRSVRTTDGGPVAPWAWDQPFVIGSAMTTPLSIHWRVGGRVRAGSGLPHVDVANTLTNLETDEAYPVFGTQTDRLAPFFAVDLRVDWSTSLPAGGQLTVYLDVQNATAADNEEIVAWSDDWRETTPIHGLPLLPALGISATW